VKKQIIDYSVVQEKMWKNTYDALKLLVDNSYYAQISFIPQWGCEEKSYWKEFCTVRLTTSRRSGHTTSVCKLAHEYFDKAIFLSPSLEISKNLNLMFRNLQRDNSDYKKITDFEILTSNGGYFFGTHNSIDKFRGIDCEAVIIDGTFSLSHQKEEDVYEILGPCMCKHPQKFFIFVQ